MSLCCSLYKIQGGFYKRDLKQSLRIQDFMNGFKKKLSRYNPNTKDF